MKEDFGCLRNPIAPFPQSPNKRTDRQIAIIKIKILILIEGEEM
jgi:hypothetical protein